MEIWIFNFPEKYFAACVGPFSATYFPIAALSSGVYQLYFPRLAVDTVVAVNTAFSTNSFGHFKFPIRQRRDPSESDTNKLKGELEDELLFLALYEKYFNKDIALLIE